MAITIERRRFIALLGGATAARSLAARAQQPGLPVIGWLGSGSAEGYVEELAAFRRVLAESGYVEGRNVAIEYRWAEGHYDQLPALAADLIDRKVTVIAAGGGSTGYAAKSLTTKIYPVHVMTRKSFGLMTRKLSVTESQRSAQFPDTFAQKTERRIGELSASCVALIIA